MRSYYAQGMLLALVLTAGASGQDFGSPALLPVAHQEVQVGPANPAATDVLPSPSDSNSAAEAYQNAMRQWGNDLPPDAGCANGCGGYGSGGNRWFGSVGALIMGSPNRNSTAFTYNATTNLPVLQSGQQNNVFSGGVDVLAGRTFGCGNWGVAFNYWGIYPSNQTTDIYNTNYPINSYLDFSTLDYNGNPGQVYFDNAVHHRLVTGQQINSVELDLFGNCGCGGLFGCNTCCGPCAPRLGTGWMMGVRYFQFNDYFAYYSDNTDALLDGSANEIQYRVNTRNNLFGFQLGGGLNYRLCNCFTAYGTARAGVYGNHAIVNQAIYGSAGDATLNTGAGIGTNYRFQSSNTNLAFLGQLDLGGRYQFSQCWSVVGGYRIVGVTGVATTDGQIPGNFSYLANAQQVHIGDCLLLHGAYIGAQFCW